MKKIWNFFSKLLGKDKPHDQDDHGNASSGISSYRYHGRWYGIMLVLGEQSGRDMKELCKDNASEIIAMAELSDEFPEDYKYVKKLFDLENGKKADQPVLNDDMKQRDYLLGALEAKKVSLSDRKWERLFIDGDIL